MVRILIPLGWVGVMILITASYYGYQIEPGSDDVGGHLITALLSAAPLLMVYVCLTIYLIGTRRLVRRSRSAGREIFDRYRQTTRRTFIACALGATPLILLFATGLPTHTGRWEPAAHHAMSYLALACQVVALTWLWRTVANGERLLGEVAAAEYNDAAPGPPPG